MEKKILDYGSIKLVESYGSDASIIEAARMSTSKGFEGWGRWIGDIKQPSGKFERGDLELNTVAAWKAEGMPNPFFRGPMTYGNIEFVPGDEKLLAYLYRNKHATPFEMAGMIIEVKAPLFVFREWHRHRTQSYNEMSARYVPMPNENFAPAPETMLEVPGALNPMNKQAGTVAGSEVLTHESALEWLQEVEDYYQHGERVYQSGLRRGVRKEHARIVVPVARYSRMRAAANLRNWLAFLTLRMDVKAQWEIRQYANAVGEIIAEQFPRTWALFAEGRGNV